MSRKPEFVGSVQCSRCGLIVPVEVVRKGLLRREAFQIFPHNPGGGKPCGSAGKEVSENELIPNEALM